MVQDLSVIDQQDQTPIKYRRPRKYKVGTGVVVLQDEAGNFYRKVIQEQSYKKSQKILQEFSDSPKYVAFKWIPHKVMRPQKLLAYQKCSGQCIQTCVKPGCVCVNGQCISSQ